MIAAGLPSYRDVVEAMGAAEQAEGWLNTCEVARRYLAVNHEFVHALADRLRRADQPIVEVCAGDGELAVALRGHDVEVIATDANPPPGASTSVCADAITALSRYRPSTVLGAFVPFDADIDQAALAAPFVMRYFVLNARLGGQLGHAALWQNPGWRAVPLPDVSRWMICRHDVWMGQNTPIIQHGEAWLFKRCRTKNHG